MGKRIFLAVVCGLLVASAAFAGHTLDGPPVIPPKPGETFADMPLPGTLTPEQMRYLGLHEKTALPTLADIKADYLLLELFSMYCPYCQREAPHVNELFTLLAKSPADNKLKILGVGIGNSPFEVDVFREKFAIPLPLFSDEDFALHHRVGQVGTPFFLLIKRVNNGEAWEVVHTQEGPFDSVASFYETILRKAGLQ